MQLYYNDLYPNQGLVSTANQTIPEADDKKALADEGTQNINVKATPKERKNIWIVLAIILGVGILMGVSK